MTSCCAGTELERVTPAVLPSLMPCRPTLSSTAEAWGDLVLQRFQHSPSLIDVPALRDHAFVLNLGQPLLIAKTHPGGHTERRWAESGHMSVTPSGHALKRDAMSRADLLFIHLSPDLVARVAEDVYGIDRGQAALLPRFAVPDPTLDRLGRSLLAEFEAELPGSDLTADCLGRAIALNLLRRHSSLAPPRPERPPSIAGGRLRKVVEYMNEHMDEALPLARLAELTGLSPSRFACAFREATGQPPHRFLLALRIERARDLLARTDLPVIQVALECGFEQPGHFATTFRLATGLGPRAWRAARRS